MKLKLNPSGSKGGHLRQRACDALALALEAAPEKRDPVPIHLAGLGSEKSRRSVDRALALAAEGLGETTSTLDWTALRSDDLVAVRARLLERGLAPATVNHALSAVRGVLHAAVRLGLMSVEDAEEACSVTNVKVPREPVGRAL